MRNPTSPLKKTNIRLLPLPRILEIKTHFFTAEQASRQTDPTRGRHRRPRGRGHSNFTHATTRWSRGPGVRARNRSAPYQRQFIQVGGRARYEDVRGRGHWTQRRGGLTSACGRSQKRDGKLWRYVFFFQQSG